MARWPSSTGLHDAPRDVVNQLGRRERTRRERAHAAGVRPAVLVEDALVVLRASERDRRPAVAQVEERDLRSGQALFDHDARAGVAELLDPPSPREPRPRPPARLAATVTPFPAARPSAFTTTGNPNAVRDAASAASAVSQTTKRAVGIRCSLHERLRVGLRALEGRAKAGRTDHRQAQGPKPVRDAPFEGSFGPDHRQIDPFPLRQRSHGVRIQGVHVKGAAHRGHARIARGGDDFGVFGVPGETPGEGVFAPSGAEYKHFHGGPFFHKEKCAIPAAWAPEARATLRCCSRTGMCVRDGKSRWEGGV